MPQGAGDDDEAEQPICRICFAGEGTEGGGQALISPCRCGGSQKFVHLSCLRRWQRSVQLGGSNHPQDAAREDRHEVCNVCRGRFDLPPQDRAAMLSELANMRPEEVSPGLLLVTKRTAADSAAAGSGMSFMIRAFLETKAAHFREAVYVLTEVRPAAEAAGAAGARSDGSDTVLGVNLSRALDAPDVSKLEEDLDEAALQAYVEQGVEVLWMNGGPVRPKAVTAIAVLERLAGDQRAQLLRDRGLQELVAGDQAVVHGSLEAILAAASEDRAWTGIGAPPSYVLAWAGFAQWSRTQLLGEVARGSWGWCRAAAADVSAAVAARNGAEGVSPLWDVLRPADRLRWAPDNEMSRDFETRLGRAPASPAAPPGGATREESADQDAEAVDTLVRQFEVLRRGN